MNLGVAQREGITLVVVIRLVLGVGVVDLNAQSVLKTLADPEGPAPVFAPGAGFDSGHSSNTVCSVGSETGAPRGTQLRRIAIDESGEVFRVRPVVLDEKRIAVSDLPLNRGARGRSSRVHEILVCDEDARVVGTPDGGR